MLKRVFYVIPNPQQADEVVSGIEHMGIERDHIHSLALWFMYYNFCRAHQTLTRGKHGIHTTPAMAAGLATHVWTLAEVLALAATLQQHAA